MFSDLKEYLWSYIVQLKNKCCADDEEIEIFGKIKKAVIAEKETNLDDKFKDKSTYSSECLNMQKLKGNNEKNFVVVHPS